MFKVDELIAGIDDVEILKGFTMQVGKGEVHAIMGPNGSGKSTLAKVLAGDPRYDVRSGSAELEGKDLLSMEPEDRALAGFFMAYQYPVEVPGVTNESFLRMALNAKRAASGAEPLDPLEFSDLIQTTASRMKFPLEYLKRDVNHGFSGGEKKRNEIMQMAVLEPKLAILDETDSGLDVDALRIVSEGVNSMKSENNAIILITHYERLLQNIVPDYVHIMAEGRIVLSGGKELAAKLEAVGYEKLIAEGSVGC